LNFFIVSLFSDISGVAEKTTAAKSECKTGRQIDGDFTAAVSPYQCSVCERVYQCNFYLVRHLKFHENNLINKKGFFQCDVCKKQFKRSTNLNQHVKLVHEAVRSFQCKQCEKSFKSKLNLTNHLLVHSDVRAFNVPCFSNPKIHYQVTAKFTAMLKHLNVNNVAKLSHFNIIYHVIFDVTLMYYHSSARNVTKLL
jgi:uncharacterized Zn-finger protein